MKNLESIDGMTFHRSGAEKTGLTVARLPLRKAEKTAPHILEIMHASYTRLFTEPTETNPEPLLSKGAVNTQFGPARENITRQAETMKRSLASGAAYWILKLGSYPNGDGIVGFAKTTPSKPGKLRRFVEPANCFIGDLVTAGDDLDDSRALMFTAITDYRDDRKVVINAQDGNDTENAWLIESGFEYQGAIGPLNIGGDRLGQHRYVHLSVGGLSRILTAQAPWLADGLPHITHA